MSAIPEAFLDLANCPRIPATTIIIPDRQPQTIPGSALNGDQDERARRFSGMQSLNIGNTMISSHNSLITLYSVYVIVSCLLKSSSNNRVFTFDLEQLLDLQ